MSSIIYPDYTKSHVNLISSIQRYFGLIPKHNTLPLLDKNLNKDFDNIILIILDGMGSNIMQSHLAKNGFFRVFHQGDYVSNFPSSTVPSITTLRTGLTPIEHNYLGWRVWSTKYNKTIQIWKDLFDDTDTTIPNFNAERDYCPTDELKTKFRWIDVTPIFNHNIQNERDFCHEIVKAHKEAGRKFIWAYWPKPDSILHDFGCFSKEASECIQHLEDCISKLADCVEKNTLIIVTADHGHKDSEGVNLQGHPKLMDCIINVPHMEPRASAFRLKENKSRYFYDYFMEQFGKDFKLYHSHEVENLHLLGVGAPHPNFQESFCDFLAIATGDVALYKDKKNSEAFKSMHGGITEDEMLVPLIVYRT